MLHKNFIIFVKIVQNKRPFTIFIITKFGMQIIFKIRRIAPIVAFIALIVLASSCATGTKKYGCPNHISTPTFSSHVN